jgi:hypothetical protein
MVKNNFFKKNITLNLLILSLLISEHIVDSDMKAHWQEYAWTI